MRAFFGDFVIVLFGVVGVFDAISSAMPPEKWERFGNIIIGQITESIVSFFASEGASVASALLLKGELDYLGIVTDFFTTVFWAVLPAIYQITGDILSQSLTYYYQRLIRSAIEKVFFNIFLGKAIIYLGIDLGMMAGIISGAKYLNNNFQQFSFTDVVPGETFSMDPPDSSPYMWVSDGTVKAGWNGTWFQFSRRLR